MIPADLLQVIAQQRQRLEQDQLTVLRDESESDRQLANWYTARIPEFIAKADMQGCRRAIVIESLFEGRDVNLSLWLKDVITFRPEPLQLTGYAKLVYEWCVSNRLRPYLERYKTLSYNGKPQRRTTRLLIRWTRKQAQEFSR